MLVLGCVLLLAQAPASTAIAETASPRRFVDLRLIGTHNSYHVAAERPLVPEHGYTHPPLHDQLEDLRIRQLELDLHHHRENGFEVFHLDRLDDGTRCRDFTTALERIRDWSASRPEHEPVLVWLEPKDDHELPLSPYGPLAGRMGEIEEAVRAVFPEEGVFRPDELRGDAADLPTALAERGWPPLDRLRGRVLFALLDTGAHRAEYLTDAPALQDKWLWVASRDPEEPCAALFKINDPVAHQERIRGLVERGFIVTTTADKTGATEERNALRRRAAWSSGAQYLSCDDPALLRAARPGARTGC